MGKEVTFYIVRHGETKYNVEGLIQGWVDSPLTEIGVLRTKELAIELQAVGFSRIVSSTLQRAVETAKIINEYYNLKIDTFDDLREVNFGSYDGIRFTPEIGEYLNNIVDDGYESLGGESVTAVLRRYLGCLNKIYSESKSGDKILVVGHRSVMIYVYAYLNNTTRGKMAERLGANLNGMMANGSILELMQDDEGIHFVSLIP